MGFVGVCGEDKPPCMQLPLSRCFRSWCVIWESKKDTNQAGLHLRAVWLRWPAAVCKIELRELKGMRFLYTPKQLLRRMAVEHVGNLRTAGSLLLISVGRMTWWFCASPWRHGWAMGCERDVEDPDAAEWRPAAWFAARWCTEVTSALTWTVMFVLKW